MKAMFDLRSFVMGVVLAVFVLLALGASLKDLPQVDRFRIASTANNVFVLDTATGQVWGKYVVPRRDAKGQEFMNPRLPLTEK